MTGDGWITVGVIVAMVVVMAANLAGPDLVLLGAVTLLLLFGILDPLDAFVGFANPAVVTIGALFVVAAGVKETGGLDLAGRLVLGRPRSLAGGQLRMMFPVAALSAFLNNTPVVAMFVPLVTTWSRRCNFSVSLMLMPLSYAAILGGMCTLIGTSTNLVVAGLAEARDPSIEFQIFEIAQLGIPALGIGMLFIVVTSQWLLKDRRGAMQEFGKAREYSIAMRVERGSPVIGQSIEDAGLRSLRGVYLYEIERGVRTEITLPRTGRNPVWSPDGREVAFTMSTEESAEVPHIVSIDGESPPRPLIAGATFEQFTNDWSRDGSRILTTQWSSEADWQLYSLRRDGDSWASSPVLTTPAAEWDGMFSPDGEWIAYMSDISGRIEVFIRRIEEPPDRRQVSVAGGAGGFHPLWAPDGGSVYYFELNDGASNSYWNGRLMKVDMTEVDGRLEPSAPRALHGLQYASVPGPWSLHDLHPDGKRLLYIAPPAGAAQRATGANQAYLKTGLIDEMRRALEGSP